MKNGQNICILVGYTEIAFCLPLVYATIIGTVGRPSRPSIKYSTVTRQRGRIVERFMLQI